MHHELKSVAPHFEDVRSGKKTFEVRFNDRDYQVDDTILLREWDGQDYTGRTCPIVVKHMTNFAQQEGYVVMSIEIIYDTPELMAELQSADTPARELARHVRRMGASSAMLPVMLFDAAGVREKWKITVEFESRVDPNTAPF